MLTKADPVGQSSTIWCLITSVLKRLFVTARIYHEAWIDAATACDNGGHRQFPQRNGSKPRGDGAAED